MTVVVFAKAPRPGRVKTRLGLDGAAAARLHEAFVRDTLELAVEAGLGPVELHTDAQTDAWREFPVTRRLQAEGDLGARMLAAISGGSGAVMILGSDAPSLPVELVRGMAAVEGDVVLGPSEDGGYWAILARRWDARMFDGVEWSTALARAQTVDAVRECGLSVGLGAEWFDVDEPSDLARLRGERLRSATREILQQLAPGERL